MKKMRLLRLVGGEVRPNGESTKKFYIKDCPDMRKKADVFAHTY
jgi:hypothetical protein